MPIDEENNLVILVLNGCSLTCLKLESDSNLNDCRYQNVEIDSPEVQE